MAEHDPLEESATLMSEPKRKFLASARPNAPTIAQSRVMVFHNAMNTTPRPTAPGESIGYGYMNQDKFHDREPAAIVDAVERIDPTFFHEWPRKDMSRPMKPAEKCAAVGEIAKAFYHHGLPAYGKPGLRKEQRPPAGAIGAL